MSCFLPNTFYPLAPRDLYSRLPSKQRTSAAMRASIIILASLTSLVSSAMIPSIPFNLMNMIPKNLPKSLEASCDVSTVQLPASALPPPSAGLKLALVAIGRGTQNYTCPDSTATSIPVAIGAVATLFNVSSLACAPAPISSMLPNITAAVEKVSISQIPSSLTAAGHHFFIDPTTPTFSMDDVLGTTELKKLNTTAAPANTNGNVAWLKLGAQTTGTTGAVKEIYRINTAGGSQPATCSGMASAFQVQYAAEYWFYTSS